MCFQVGRVYTSVVFTGIVIVRCCTQMCRLWKREEDREHQHSIFLTTHNQQRIRKCCAALPTYPEMLPCCSAKLLKWARRLFKIQNVANTKMYLLVRYFLIYIIYKYMQILDTYT